MYPIPGKVHNKTLNKCILSMVQFSIKPEEMYAIPGTVHNKTLYKCILSLVQFTMKP